MIRFELPVEVSRPVGDVFAFVTDPARLPEWQPNAVEVRVDPPGPLRQGSRLREVRSGPFGKRVDSLVEVHAHETDRAFDLRIVEGPLKVHVDHRFHDLGARTRIGVTIFGEAPRVLAPLLRRQFRRYYGRLAQVLEG